MPLRISTADIKLVELSVLEIVNIEGERAHRSRHSVSYVSLMATEIGPDYVQKTLL